MSARIRGTEDEAIEITAHVVRSDSRHGVDTTRIADRRLYGRAVSLEVDDPTFEYDLRRVLTLVEVAIVPERTGQSADTRHPPDGERNACAGILGRRIPGRHRRIRDGCTDGESRVQIGSETQDDLCTGCQRTIRRRVVGGNERAHHVHTNGYAVQCRRTENVCELSRDGLIEIVCDEDIERVDRADVRDADDVFERGSSEGGPTPEDAHVLRDRQLLTVANDDDRGFRSGRRIAIAIRQDDRCFSGRDLSLIRDQRSAGNSSIDLDVERHGRAFADADLTRAGRGQRRRKIRRADRNTCDER